MIKRLTIVLFAVLMVLSGCQQSNDVVGDSWIQKRKYRKGWFVNAGHHRTDKITPIRLPSTTKAPKKLERQLPKEVLTVSSVRGVDRLTYRDGGYMSEEKARPQEEVASRSVRHNSKTFKPKDLKRSSSHFTSIQVGETDEAPEALSMIAKVLAVMSGLMAAVTFVATLVLMASATGITSSALFILIVMGVMSVVAILVSLLLSYIIMERYDDDGPMQWTLFASYVFEAIILVLGYVYFIVPGW